MLHILGRLSLLLSVAALDVEAQQPRQGAGGVRRGHLHRPRIRLTIRQRTRVLEDAKAKAAKIINDADSIKADAEAAAEKIRVDADELRQRHEQRLHDVQARERKARAGAEDGRQAIAKADAKEKQFQAKIDLLQETLRAELSR
jgi:hypothetical protein